MLKVIFLVSGYPTASNPAHGIFNQRAATAISKHVNLTVIQYRLYMPGRKLYEVTDEGGFKRIILCVPYIPFAEKKMYFLNAAIYKVFTKYFCSKLLKEADIVHAGEGNLGVFSSHLKKLYNWKLLVQFIGADLDQDLHTQRSKLKNFVTGLDGVSFNSEYLKKKFIELFGQHQKMRVIYRGVDTVTFMPHIKEAGKIVFYFIGGLTNYSNYPSGKNTKGGYTLMKAWALLDKNLPDANVELRFAGPDSDSDEAKQWQQSLKQPDKVKLIGKINPSDIVDFHKNGQVAIIPSIAEGLPNAGMEACASGNAVITTPVGGIPEIIENNVNGLFFEPDNETQLYDRIKYLIENPDRISILGSAGREKMLLTFSSENFAKKYYGFYTELCRN